MTMAHGNASRTAESTAIIMIGDGLLGVLRPAEHCLIWSAGPRWWREMVGWFAAHPNVTRGAAVIEVGTGLWLALRSQQDLSQLRQDESHPLPA
jgi:hypothetical protein